MKKGRLGVEGITLRGISLLAVAILIISVAIAIGVISVSLPRSTSTNDNNSESLTARSVDLETTSVQTSSEISTTVSQTETSSSVTIAYASSLISNETNSTRTTTGVIVPLFANNTNLRSSEISQLIQIAISNPSVPMLVVYDDHGGPGNFSSLAASEIKSMMNAGIQVLGYVPTWWAQRNITVVESVIKTFFDWYHVNGIYLDQMPNWNYNAPNGSAYYTGPNGKYIPAYFSNATKYAKSIGLTKIVANAGADVPQDFLGSVDTIGTFENPFLPSLNLSAGWLSIAGLNGWHAQHDKSNFMFFSYNVPTINRDYVLEVAKYVGYMYITNGNETYDRYSYLSTYLPQLVSILAST